ncbi:MAG: rhodanese-like domain-containing protein [Candidatus Iainarchaeum archaeon]|uniref:Rhodanese-like domain-containing protein n=1 Tax=Candidatus Iainarchaeum sp. TaxID=3101447 RepID=A0A7T9DJ85_9ARCH|nr:MAG: rhodanese-like domain-containing protein [Candidatus Diapherotrites archaeon]
MVAAKDGFQSMHLNPEQALALLQSDPHAMMVDVREPWEWEQEHIAHSISLPLSTAKPSDFDRFGKEHPLLVLCAHGNRSVGVTQFLRERGFAHAQNMSGGISVISPALRGQLGKLLEGRKTHA